MGKALIQKVVEAGIIPQQTIKLLQMWRCLPDDLPEVDKQERTQQQLLGFVHEMGKLMEEDQEIPELKETDLDLETTWETQARLCTVVCRMGSQVLTIRVPAMRNRLGGVVFRCPSHQLETVLRPGTEIDFSDEEVFEVTQVEVRYVETEPRYLVCLVREVPNAEVSGMPGLISIK
jgi:hypothetical protein